MTCGLFHPLRQGMSLFAALAALFIVVVNAVPVTAADEVPDNERTGIKIRAEALPAENDLFDKRPTDSWHESMQGRIDLKTGTGGADEAASSIFPPATPKEASVPAERSETKNSGNSGRPKRDRNYAGTSVDSAGIVSGPVHEKKKSSMTRRGETTKARHVKRVVVHDDSPELQVRNEKLRKIKGHFRSQLENREERKPK